VAGGEVEEMTTCFRPTQPAALILIQHRLPPFPARLHSPKHIPLQYRFSFRFIATFRHSPMLRLNLPTTIPFLWCLACRLQSFIGTLKKEMLQGGRFQNLQESRTELFEYIDGYYNSHRHHSALGCQASAHFELQLSINH